MYHNRQKLSERKVSRFTGFHSNVGKALMGLASSVLKESRCSKDSSGQFLHFVENPEKPQNFSPTLLLSFTVFYEVHMIINTQCTCDTG